MQTVLKKNQTGFTLFELLVSITIIGTISAIFIVNVNLGNRDNELNEAVQIINDEIRKLQNLALSSTQSSAWGLFLQTTNPNNKFLTIFTDTNNDTTLDAGEEISSMSPVNLPDNITIGGGPSNDFSGWDYETGTMMNSGNMRNLIVFFHPPDSRIEVHIRRNASQDATSGNSYITSFAEFYLYNIDSSENILVRINDYGLFDVIDN